MAERLPLADSLPLHLVRQEWAHHQGWASQAVKAMNYSTNHRQALQECLLPV